MRRVHGVTAPTGYKFVHSGGSDLMFRAQEEKKKKSLQEKTVWDLPGLGTEQLEKALSKRGKRKCAKVLKLSLDGGDYGSGLPTSIQLFHEHLSELCIVHTNLARISLEGFRSLTILNLVDNAIESLDGDLTFPCLKAFRVTGNKLDKIPDWLRKSAKTLDGLWVGSNAIKAIPEWIDELTLLRTFWVHHNSLTSLPPQIASLKNLVYFNATGNQSLPAEWAIDTKQMSEVHQLQQSVLRCDETPK